MVLGISWWLLVVLCGSLWFFLCDIGDFWCFLVAWLFLKNIVSYWQFLVVLDDFLVFLGGYWWLCMVLCSFW